MPLWKEGSYSRFYFDETTEFNLQRILVGAVIDRPQIRYIFRFYAALRATNGRPYIIIFVWNYVKIDFRDTFRKTIDNRKFLQYNINMRVPFSEIYGEWHVIRNI